MANTLLDVDSHVGFNPDAPLELRQVKRRIAALAGDLANRGIVVNDGDPFAAMLDHVGDAVVSDKLMRDELQRQSVLWVAAQQ